MTDSMSRMIAIHHFGQQSEAMVPEAMAALAGASFPLSERVPGAPGEAFDFARWYAAWRGIRGLGDETPQPTHIKVEAADTFEALIPWEQLEGAAVQFALDGAPLPKGGPARLYVPNGSSACLNVKGVVACRFLFDEDGRGHVSYGFKHTFTPEEMRLKR